MSKATSISIDNERMALTTQATEASPGFETAPETMLPALTTQPTVPATKTHHHHHHICNAELARRRSITSNASRDSSSEQQQPPSVIFGRSPEQLPNDVITQRYDFVPPVVEESDAVILEETEIARHVCGHRRRGKLSTPPPTKNVSFGELHEQSYIEQVILPFPLQYVQNHRHAGKNHICT